jgi:hypothetical protein
MPLRTRQKGRRYAIRPGISSCSCCRPVERRSYSSSGKD